TRVSGLRRPIPQASDRGRSPRTATCWCAPAPAGAPTSTRRSSAPTRRDGDGGAAADIAPASESDRPYLSEPPVRTVAAEQAQAAQRRAQQCERTRLRQIVADDVHFPNVARRYQQLCTQCCNGVVGLNRIARPVAKIPII